MNDNMVTVTPSRGKKSKIWRLFYNMLVFPAGVLLFAVSRGRIDIL